MEVERWRHPLRLTSLHARCTLSAPRLRDAPQCASQAEAALAKQAELHCREKESLYAHLQAKIDAQSKQLTALRASTARGRAIKYWASMKSTRAAQLEMTDDLELDDLMALAGFAEFRPPQREPDVGDSALWRPPPGGCG